MSEVLPCLPGYLVRFLPVVGEEVTGLEIAVRTLGSGPGLASLGWGIISLGILLPREHYLALEALEQMMRAGVRNELASGVS